MDVVEAIKERKSIRAFKPDPVPRDMLKKILEPALRAPSWANTQPWEFAIAGGKKLKEIQDGFVKRGVQDPTSEVARPYEFPEPYMGRIRGLQPKDRKEMTKEEREERAMNNFRNYGASTCIYLLVGKPIFQQSKGLNVWALYDSGSVVQNIMLLAPNYGLGTIAQAPAGGPPDNQARRHREPLDKVAKLYGIAEVWPPAGRFPARAIKRRGKGSRATSRM